MDVKKIHKTNSFKYYKTNWSKQIERMKSYAFQFSWIIQMGFKIYYCYISKVHIL